ncbi:MAG: putative 4-mercaptohistidine N1-methyltransferase [Verrucomicrobiales bacterium]|nr:putative 4-mercaptohistidine N1-methyltransferase [Verrucomicrobiales bacterium]
MYETDRLLQEYLLFHYGQPQELLPWPDGPHSALDFPRRTVEELLDAASIPVPARALDLGCAVGRSAFHLRHHVTEVIGIDFSHRFVQAAADLATTGHLPYRLHEEGTRYRDATATVPSHLQRDHVHFEQGDAMALRQDLGRFEIVHAANLLCRLSHPQRLLDRLPELVTPGGQLLITTPCTWLAEFTPPENWPTDSTLDWLDQQLQAHFTREHRQDLPFLIREHARKFQWSVALGTRWRRH